MEKCSDPTAPIVTCAICDRLIFTCERTFDEKDIEDAICIDYRCPVHPEGVEVEEGVWVCSLECHDKYDELYGE